MHFCTITREGELCCMDRLFVSRYIRQRNAAAAYWVQFSAMQFHSGIERAGDRNVLTRELCELGDIELRRVEIDLNWAGIRKCPFRQTYACVEGQVAMR